MLVTKIVSATTAVSMATTGMIVAASANSATSDAIEEALSSLRTYGIVAESMENSSHFESNFAAYNLNLARNYDVGHITERKDRTIDFKVTTDEKFENGEAKYYYFGVYCGGQRIAVKYQSAEGVISKDVIAVKFDKPETKRFVINVPAEYHGETVVVHKLGFPEDIEEKTVADLMPIDEGLAFAPVDNSTVTKCVVSDTMTVAGEMFTTDKRVFVGSDIYKDIVKENDGRYSYKGNIIANNSNEFIESANAKMEVSELISNIKTASEALKTVNTNGENALFYTVHGGIAAGSNDADEINKKFKSIKENPEYSLLVNVYLNEGETNYFTLNTGHGVGDWDVDTASRIVFNFIGGEPETTTVQLGDGFRGTAIAPDSKVIIGSTMCGAIYAPSLNVMNGEVHMAPYNFLNFAYSAYFEPEEEETTTPEETTIPETEETTTAPETEETTTAPETEETTTTVPETEETTTTVPETEATTTTPPETEATTTVPETEATTTTPAPETTVTTTAPETEATTTTPAPETTVTTTAPETEATTTTPPETTVTTTIPETEATTTTPTIVEEEDETTTTPTIVEEEDETTTTTVDAEQETETTTTLIVIDEEVPLDELIFIDEEVPLSDLPMNTGVDSHIGMFAAIGGGALLVGAGAQAYSVFLKKKK